MRAREIAERLFAPMEREPGTIVIDFEGARRRRRRGGGGGAEEEDELVDDDFKALVNEFGVADEEEEEMAPETREAKVEAEAPAETTATTRRRPIRTTVRAMSTAWMTH